MKGNVKPGSGHIKSGGSMAPGAGTTVKAKNTGTKIGPTRMAKPKLEGRKAIHHVGMKASEHGWTAKPGSFGGD